MSSLVRDVDELLADAIALEPDVTDWLTRGRDAGAAPLAGVAIAFAQRACSTAARGAEDPPQADHARRRLADADRLAAA